jgi:heat shock protein HslJ
MTYPSLLFDLAFTISFSGVGTKAAARSSYQRGRQERRAMEKRRIRMKIRIVLLLALLALAACQPATSLEGTTWALESLGGKALVAGSQITATFDAANKQVSGAAGCNHYFGSYTLAGASLSFSAIGSTKMACPGDGIMNQEQAYLSALQSVSGFRVKGKALQLNYPGGILVFRAQ